MSTTKQNKKKPSTATKKRVIKRLVVKRSVNTGKKERVNQSKRDELITRLIAKAESLITRFERLSRLKQNPEYTILDDGKPGTTDRERVIINKKLNNPALKKPTIDLVPGQFVNPALPQSLVQAVSSQIKQQPQSSDTFEQKIDTLIKQQLEKRPELDISRYMQRDPDAPRKVPPEIRRRRRQDIVMDDPPNDPNAPKRAPPETQLKRNFLPDDYIVESSDIDGGLDSLGVPSLENTRPPAINFLLENYGDWKLFKMRVVRIPINETFEQLANLVTLGKFNKAKIDNNIDLYFHLFIDMAVRSNDGKVALILLEKNQKVTVKYNRQGGLKFGEEAIDVPNPDITVSQLIETAEKWAQEHQPGCPLYIYDAVNCNCQRFVQTVLRANGLWNPSMDSFVIQNVRSAIPKWLSKVVKGATNLAARFT